MQVYNTSQYEEIAFELKNDKAAILPTDTVWGIVSLNEKKIYEIKQRPSNKKIITFVNSIDSIGLPPEYKKEISKYWPGQLTIVYLGKSYRMPNSKFILNLIDLVGPLYSSSANISGKDPIKSIPEAKNVFKNDEFKLVLIQPPDEWRLSNSPSTIVNLDTLTVVREGKVDGNKIINNLKKGK